MPYYFNLPLITDLTPDQQFAVDTTQPLALSGGPGTGKSVVSLWRHIRNHSTGLRKSLLLTYTKTLEHYLKASANMQNTNAGNNIDRLFWWLSHNAKKYDEIIIDEGQDIKQETFIKYFNYTDRISYGADEKQIIFLKPEEWTELKEMFATHEKFEDNRRFGTITLQRNFRNSKEILLFTRSVFPNFMIPQITINGAAATGLKPIMKLDLGWGEQNQLNEIVSIINSYKNDTENIAVLVPFASQVESYYELIRKEVGSEIEITKYQNELEEFEGFSGIHVTTFKSSKGTEFHTVIIPEFDSFPKIISNPKFKTTVNDYYVAFTRTKTNLFLLCKNGFPNIGDINTVTIE